MNVSLMIFVENQYNIFLIGTLTGFRYHIPDVESVLKKLTLMQILIDHKVQGLTAVFNTDKSLLLARASERKKVRRIHSDLVAFVDA